MAAAVRLGRGLVFIKIHSKSSRLRSCTSPLISQSHTVHSQRCVGTHTPESPLAGDEVPLEVDGPEVPLEVDGPEVPLGVDGSTTKKRKRSSSNVKELVEKLSTMKLDKASLDHREPEEKYLDNELLLFGISVGRGENIYENVRVYQRQFKKKEKNYENKLMRFDHGKKHLANMMGADDEYFSLKQMQEAVKYLLPSGLFEPKARPDIYNPKIRPPVLNLDVDLTGRPTHYLFYTKRPHYNHILHHLAMLNLKLLDYEYRMNVHGKIPEEEKKLNYKSSKCKTISHGAFQHMLGREKIDKEEFKNVHKLLDRVTQRTYSYEFCEYDQIFSSLRKFVSGDDENIHLPKKIRYDPGGKQYVTTTGKRKTAFAHVKMIYPGTGQVTVEGKPLINYFTQQHEREQILFPLDVVNRMLDFDIEVQVEGGGKIAQAGATRLAISQALCYFIKQNDIARLNLAGLLTIDARKKERKKPGQKKARRKFTWKAR